MGRRRSGCNVPVVIYPRNASGSSSAASEDADQLGHNFVNRVQSLLAAENGDTICVGDMLSPTAPMIAAFTELQSTAASMPQVSLPASLGLS